MAKGSAEDNVPGEVIALMKANLEDIKGKNATKEKRKRATLDAHSQHATGGCGKSRIVEEEDEAHEEEEEDYCRTCIKNIF
ncbi:hypothetical protein ACLOJK_000677 [Asimina triloba]